MTNKRSSIFVIATTLLCLATAAVAGDTTLIRHESTFLRDSDFQLNSGWLIHNSDRIQYQLYAFYETGGGTWNDLNACVGPLFHSELGTLSLPVGMRLHPEEGWRLSHAITKANFFGRVGSFPLFLVNDLSWALGGKGSNEHFLQQQLAWQPKDSRVGLGVQAEQVLVGSQVVSAKLGPVLKLTYAKSANWAWTLDVIPFRDLHSHTSGVKLNFITLHFGK